MIKSNLQLLIFFIMGCWYWCKCVHIYYAGGGWCWAKLLQFDPEAPTQLLLQLPLQHSDEVAWQRPLPRNWVSQNRSPRQVPVELMAVCAHQLLVLMDYLQSPCSTVRHSWQKLGTELSKLADLHSQKATAYLEAVRKPLQELLPQLEETRQEVIHHVIII